MQTFTSICLLCWLQFNGVESEEFPLGFSEDSIDDKYSNCKDEMNRLVFQKYSKELEGTEYGKQLYEANTIKKDNILTTTEIQAISVYTGNGVYSDFNRAVRTGRNIYGTSFKYHILHFFLTSALQKLKKADSGICYTTYRRDNNTFIKTTEKMRFGNFASSSLQPDMTQFGRETCFEIKTCRGAVVEQYSAYPAEREVLIPPYEVFEFEDKNVEKLSDCKTVYALKSAGTHSNLDCRLVPGFFEKLRNTFLNCVRCNTAP